MVEPEAERLIAATGADFRIGGARAFYSPLGDFVQVPPPQAYFEPINWHRTAFHELGHNAERRIMPRRSSRARRLSSLSSAACRHSQSASRNARSWSSGLYRPGFTSGAVTRASAAMDLLHHGVDQAVIALWLGHESVETTQIY